MVGALLGFVIAGVCVAFIGMGLDIAPFIDPPSMGIVFGGIIGGLLIALPMDAVTGAPKVFLKALFYNAADPVETIKKLCEYSELARRDGILALENVLEGITDPFLRQGLQLAVDGTDPELITDIMETELDNLDNRHAMGKRVWDTFKNGGPSWGALGTVIGLIQMLRGGVEDPNALTAGMAVALITTFYGSMVASFAVGPMVDRMDTCHKDEMYIKAILMKGVMSIQAGDNPRILEQKLKVFVSPAKRGFGKE